MSDFTTSFTIMTPTEHDEAASLVAELERWDPMFRRLFPGQYPMEQTHQLAKFLNQKITCLKECDVTGTLSQQHDILERLTKLQEGPMGTRTILAEAIGKRLRALSGDESDGRDMNYPKASQTVVQKTSDDFSIMLI